MTPEHEIIKRLKAENEALRDLLEECALSLALAKWGALADGHRVMVGEYAFEIRRDANAEIVARLVTERGDS